LFLNVLQDDSLSLSVCARRLVRVLGASGSAIKGIGCFSLGAEAAQKFGVASVGYDQRLSLWTYSDSPAAAAAAAAAAAVVSSAVETYDLSVGPSPPLACTTAACPLRWTAANIVNIGDVNSMALSVADTESVCLAVIGEGFQILEAAAFI
jgi:hypothetical protein